MVCLKRDWERAEAGSRSPFVLCVTAPLRENFFDFTTKSTKSTKEVCVEHGARSGENHDYADPVSNDSWFLSPQNTVEVFSLCRCALVRLKKNGLSPARGARSRRRGRKGKRMNSASRDVPSTMLRTASHPPTDNSLQSMALLNH